MILVILIGGVALLLTTGIGALVVHPSQALTVSPDAWPWEYLPADLVAGDSRRWFTEPTSIMNQSQGGPGAEVDLAIL